MLSLLLFSVLTFVAVILNSTYLYMEVIWARRNHTLLDGIVPVNEQDVLNNEAV